MLDFFSFQTKDWIPLESFKLFYNTKLDNKYTYDVVLICIPFSLWTKVTKHFQNQLSIKLIWGIHGFPPSTNGL